MAKKKTVRRTAPSPKKRPVKKKAARSKSPVVRRKSKVVRKPSRSRGADLGRARVSGTAELDQHFLKDYEARQVFTFLGVKTLKELESFSAQDIIDRLTAPMVTTVNRIRKALAMQNRCLAGDQKFAVEFKRQMLAALKK